MTDNTLEVMTPEEGLVETEEVETEEEIEEDPEEDTPNEEPVMFMGRQYASIEEAEKQFKEMQKRATKAEQALKDHDAKVKAEQELAKFKDMDPEDKLDWLAQKQLERAELKAEVEEVEETFAANTAEVETFVKAHPFLKQYPILAKQFVQVATLPEYANYTLDSIFDVEFKPLIDDLGGKKVRVTKKKAPTSGAATVGFTNEQIEAMSPAEYEKNREKILAQLNNK